MGPASREGAERRRLGGPRRRAGRVERREEKKGEVEETKKMAAFFSLFRLCPKNAPSKKHARNHDGHRRRLQQAHHVHGPAQGHAGATRGRGARREGAGAGAGAHPSLSPHARGAPCSTRPPSVAFYRARPCPEPGQRGETWTKEAAQRGAGGRGRRGSGEIAPSNPHPGEDRTRHAPFHALHTPQSPPSLLSPLSGPPGRRPARPGKRHRSSEPPYTLKPPGNARPRPSRPHATPLSSSLIKGRQGILVPSGKI